MSQGRIYTKLGDDGSTGRLYGGRIPKTAPLIQALGSIDEAISALGLARAQTRDAELADTILHIQRDLFVVAADLSANPDARARLVPEVSRVTAGMTARIESLIDQLVARRPLRPVFVVPGANVVSATLDLARAIARRAERDLIACRIHAAADQPVNPHAANYLNRISDLLYVLARQASGDADEPLSHLGSPPRD